MSRIFIFGGSFDPFHQGHIDIINFINKKYNRPKIVIVPNYLSPFKKKSSNPRKRIEIIVQSVKKLKNVICSDYEINKKRKCYTIDTLKHFINKYRTNEIYLIIGQDHLSTFDKWKSCEEISELAKIVCFKRSNSVTRQEKDIISKYNIKLLDNKVNDLSSTNIRSGEKPFISENIIYYCIKNKIYIEEILKSMMSDYRLKHSYSVMKQIVKISKGLKVNESNLLISSLFHDIAKEWSDQQLIEYNRIYKCTNEKQVGTLHGPVGAHYCKVNIGIKSKEILNAIKYHTIPRKNPTLIEKLLFIADKTEPTRKQKIGNIITKIAINSINEAFNMSVCYSKIEIFKKNNKVNPLKDKNFNSYFKKITDVNKSILLQTLKFPSYN